MTEYPPPRQCGLFIPSTSDGIHPNEGVWFRFAESGGYVPIYTDEPLANVMIAEAGKKGMSLKVAAPSTVDVMTSLLADLLSLGATHVCFNPRARGGDQYIPITEAIIGFQLTE